ncbi:MAG: LytTR family transcriptional regulator DNA-binding domain-containing protein [Ruminiclostridium sp.]
MEEENALTIQWRKREYVIPLDKILYVIMKRNNAEIHASGGRVYHARRTYTEIKQALNDDFIEVKRGCMVSTMAIYRFKKKLELINGESIGYTARRKKALIEQLHRKRQSIIDGFSAEGVPATPEEYRRHYISCENLPFAFTDIEMVFNSEAHAVDWIFRYGNEALARLEKIPLKRLIDSRFSSLFPKMDTKWLFNYERSAIYGEILEIIDYSPEIDTTLKIISFPTFKGHCGCILFDVSQIWLTNGGAKSALEYCGITSEDNSEN